MFSKFEYEVGVKAIMTHAAGERPFSVDFVACPTHITQLIEAENSLTAANGVIHRLFHPSLPIISI